MSAIKERIYGAVTVMSEEDAYKVWELIKQKFTSVSWEDIEEVEPDEFDLQMLSEIENNPECKEFMSSDEAMRALGL